MFFGAAVEGAARRLFDTHPPLDERIRRVHPRFQRGEYRAKPPLPRRRRPREQTGRAERPRGGLGPHARRERALVGTLDPARSTSPRACSRRCRSALREACAARRRAR